MGATSGFQKIAVGIVAVGMVTALLSHGSTTAGVIGSLQNLFTGSLSTAIKGTQATKSGA